MKTYYYIQEKYPESDWRILAGIGRLPNLKEAEHYFAQLNNYAEAGAAEPPLYRILKVTEEFL